MQYQTQIPIRGDEERVLRQATKLLIASGFRLTDQSENQVTLQGPGLRSTNQNPILGATTVSLRRSHTLRKKLAVDADLGGVRWMQKFVTLFPTLMVIGLGGIPLIVLSLLFPNGPQANAPPGLLGKLGLGLSLLVALFLVFAVIMNKTLRQNTERAIDEWIRNADELTQRESQ